MKTYSNKVIINGELFNNLIEADNFKEALTIQKERKLKSRNKFVGRLELAYSL